MSVIFGTEGGCAVNDLLKKSELHDKLPDSHTDSHSAKKLNFSAQILKPGTMEHG